MRSCSPKETLAWAFFDIASLPPPRSFFQEERKWQSIQFVG